MFNLKNKKIILTGAAGILGEHFTRGYLEHHADLVLTDINAHELNKRKEQFLKEFPSANISTYVCDISSPKDVTEMVREIFAKEKMIHVLHNNAGGKPKDLKAYFKSFEEYDYDIWKEGLSVNLDAVFLMSKEVGKYLVKQGQGGSLIQTASIYGCYAPDQRIYEGAEYLGVNINTPASYSAAKAAVIGLTKYLATYWAKYNIRVNALTPGGVESGQNDEFIRKYSSRVPLARMARGNEMAAAAVYLASDDSSYVTGQNLIVDGGLSAW